MYAARPRLTCGDLRYFFLGHTVFLEQAQFRGAANCLGARAAVEHGEDVGDVHFHSARAEHECAGDLGVGLPLPHELEDLPLATGQVAGAKTTRRSLPEALDYWFAQRL